MDDVLDEFLDEAGRHLDEAAGEVARLGDEEARLRLLRRLHTLKGTAAFLALPRAAALAHAAEGLIEARGAVDAAALAALLARLWEVLRAVACTGTEPPGEDADLLPEPPERAAFAALAARLTSPDAGARPSRRAGLLPCAGPLAGPDRPAPPRPEPLARAFAPLPALVRGLGRVLGKPLDLSLRGGEVVVAPEIAACLRDALPHLIRNAADHGIEAAPLRLAAAKPERGRIAVAAEQEAGSLTLTVRDDGAGLRREAVRRAARADGSPEALVFRPGLSTSAAVSAVSGRGIGLDAVRARVEESGGSIALRSEDGQGTACVMRWPRDLPPLHRPRPTPSLPARSA